MTSSGTNTDGDTEDLPDDGPIEHPATWENELAGRAEQALGTLLGDKTKAAEGREQAEIAHEVREKYDEQHD